MQSIDRCINNHLMRHHTVSTQKVVAVKTSKIKNNDINKKQGQYCL